MSDFILTTRRSLRLRLGCAITLEGAGHRWSATTEDVGPHGCRVVAPARLPVGDPLRAVLVCPCSETPVVVNATVAWCAETAPWSVGLAFTAQDRLAAAAWFDEVAAHHLDLLLDEVPVPDRLPLAARLQPGAAGRTGALGDDEAALLRLAERRATLLDARGQLDSRWGRAQRALFSLLARGLVTLQPEPGGPVPWSPPDAPSPGRGRS